MKLAKLNGGDNNHIKSDADLAHWEPSAKQSDVEIGAFLPGCSPQSAEFCIGQRQSSPVMFNRLEKRNMKGSKGKMSAKERRKMRRQKKRRMRERKRRKERRRIRKRRRRQRRRKKNRGRFRSDKSDELARLGRAGITVQHVQSEETGELKPRLNWSKYKETAKAPPFESLLTSLDEMAEHLSNVQPDDSEDTHDYEEVFEEFGIQMRNDTEIIKDFVHSDSSSSNKNRVPLPLLEDTIKLREEMVAEEQHHRHKRQAKNWKHRRRAETDA